MKSPANQPAAKPHLSRKAQLRLFWLKLHRWMGLALLVIMVGLGATGSVLVWPDTFNALLHPQRYPTVSTANFYAHEDFLTAARSALPEGDRISGLRIPTKQGAIRVSGHVNGPAPLGLGPPNRVQLWLHPKTGAVLDRQDRNLSSMWSMRAFHGHLLLKPWGREVVALAGLFLFVLAAIGLWLWWPSRGAIAQGLKWRKPLSKSMNLHRISGAIMAIILFVEAFTGAWIALPTLFSGMIDPQAGNSRLEPKGPPPSPPMDKTELPIEQAIDLALSYAGSNAETKRQIVAVAFPREKDPFWRISLADPSAGEQLYTVSDITGTVASLPNPARSGGNRVMNMIVAIHAGHLGAVWEAVIFLSGLVLPLLSVTGFLLWLQGKARKRPHPKRRLA